MRPRKARAVAGSLEQKGFRRSGGSHQFFTFYLEGRKTSLRTRISHGATECDRHVLSQMAKHLHLSSRELSSLIDCPLTYQTLAALLLKRGRISA